MAVPVAEELPAGKPMPDNLVDLRRIRESHRGPMVSDARDSSDRISRHILASVPLCAEAASEVPFPDLQAHRIMTDSTLVGNNGVFEQRFRWRDPAPPKRVALFPTIRFILLFTAFGTALTYIGFHLVLYLAK